MTTRLKEKYMKYLTINSNVRSNPYIALPAPWIKEFKWLEMADILPSGKRNILLEVYPVIVIKRQDDKSVAKTGFLIMNFVEKWKDLEEVMKLFDGKEVVPIKVIILDGTNDNTTVQDHKSNDVKNTVLKVRAVIERHKDELARRISAILSSYGEDINLTPDTKTFKFLLAVLLTFLAYGSDNITIGHIAWAYWALFKTSPNNILTLEEVLSDDRLKQEMLHKDGSIYNEVRYTYYNARRRYKIINKILIPVDSRVGRKTQFKINTFIMQDLLKVLESLYNQR